MYSSISRLNFSYFLDGASIFPFPADLSRAVELISEFPIYKLDDRTEGGEVLSASLMTRSSRNVIYDFYFQTADANTAIPSAEIKASISVPEPNGPLNARAYRTVRARNKLITSVFGTRMSNAPPTNSKFSI